MNCKLPRVILETNELYHRLSLWVTACIIPERFDSTPYCYDTCKWLRLPSSVTQQYFSDSANAILDHGSRSSMMWRHVGTVHQHFVGTWIPNYVVSNPKRPWSWYRRGHVTSLYSDIIMSDSSHHASLTPFPMTPLFQLAMSRDPRVQFSVLQWIWSFLNWFFLFFIFFLIPPPQITHRCWKCFPSARRRVEYRRNILFIAHWTFNS
jgi:hypothetical protein